MIYCNLIILAVLPRLKYAVHNPLLNYLLLRHNKDYKETCVYCM